MQDVLFILIFFNRQVISLLEFLRELKRKEIKGIFFLHSPRIKEEFQKQKQIIPEPE
jgi:hypothetical protein